MKTKKERKTLKREGHSRVKLNLKENKPIPRTNREGTHRDEGFVLESGV